MIKVSVIVPAYNASLYLKTCLDSLVKQTLQEIEIIVINDGSSDHTASIIRDYQKKYKQIVFVDNKKNMGIGKSRNIGLAKARGKYIGFLDSDDYVSVDAYDKYYHFCEENKLDFMYSHYYKVFENKIEFFKTDVISFTNVYADPSILTKVDYGPCNKLLRKDIIDKYQLRFPENIKYEDMPFIAQNLFYASRVGHFEDANYYYRVHAGSETTTMDKKVFDIFKCLDIVNTCYQKNKKIEKGLEYFNIREVTRYMLRQRYQADKKIRKSFIDSGYMYLDTHFPLWKKSLFYKKESFWKRFIKNHKCLLNLYCLIYQVGRKK